jgi:hypothetical protein
LIYSFNFISHTDHCNSPFKGRVAVSADGDIGAPKGWRDAFADVSFDRKPI